MPDYKAIARQAAQKWGIPEELYIALIQQESGFQPGLTSSAGALGIAQFMPGTARDLGIDPNDPIAALYGGAQYLRQLFDYFGNLEYATAAYNAGQFGVQTAIAQGGENWRQFLPEETRIYLANVYDATIGRAGGTPMTQPGQPVPPGVRVPDPEYPNQGIPAVLPDGSKVEIVKDPTTGAILGYMITPPGTFIPPGVDEYGQPYPPQPHPPLWVAKTQPPTAGGEMKPVTIGGVLIYYESPDGATAYTPEEVRVMRDTGKMPEKPITPYERAQLALGEATRQIAAGTLTLEQAKLEYEKEFNKLDLQNKKDIANIQAAATMASANAAASASAYASDVAAKAAAEREKTAREDIIQREVLPRSLKGIKELNIPLLGKLPLSPVNLAQIRTGSPTGAQFVNAPPVATGAGGYTPRPPLVTIPTVGNYVPGGPLPIGYRVGPDGKLVPMPVETGQPPEQMTAMPTAPAAGGQAAAINPAVLMALLQRLPTLAGRMRAA